MKLNKGVRKGHHELGLLSSPGCMAFAPKAFQLLWLQQCFLLHPCQSPGCCAGGPDICQTQRQLPTFACLLQGHQLGISAAHCHQKKTQRNGELLKGLLNPLLARNWKIRSKAIQNRMTRAKPSCIACFPK